MDERGIWTMRSRDARIAGLLYLISVGVGLVFLRYVPDQLIKSNDAAATANNIMAHQFLFRIAIAGDLICGLIWLSVVLALYQLLKDVDRTQAGLMLVLGAFLQVPFYFFNALNYIAVLLLLRGPVYLSTFSTGQLQGLAMFFIKMHNQTIVVSLILAGLWLFPFGALVYKSGFLPRTLGVWLIVNGVAWLVICFDALLTPQYADVVEKVTAPILFGEIVTAFWLLIFGARRLGPMPTP